MTQHTNSLPPVVMKPHIFDDVVLVAVCFITYHLLRADKGPHLLCATPWHPSGV